MATITICIAPRLVKLELTEEFRKNKKEKFPSDYLVIYQKKESQDDSWETLYSMGVYKQIGWYPIRGEENLNEILEFLGEEAIEWNPRHMQIINGDDF